MAVFSRTNDIALMPAVLCIGGNTIKGAEQDFSGRLGVKFNLYCAPAQLAANDDPGVFLIQSNPSPGSNENWITDQIFACESGTPNTKALTANSGIGSDLIQVTDTAAFSAGEIIFVQDDDNIVLSEWARIKRIESATDIRLIDGLTRAKELTNDRIWDMADIFTYTLPTMVSDRWRVVFQNEGATSINFVVKAVGTTIDSIA